MNLCQYCTIKECRHIILANDRFGPFRFVLECNSRRKVGHLFKKNKSAKIFKRMSSFIDNLLWVKSFIRENATTVIRFSNITTQGYAMNHLQRRPLRSDWSATLLLLCNEVVSPLKNSH